MTNQVAIFALTLIALLGFSACSHRGAESMPKMIPASDTIAESGWNDFTEPIPYEISNNWSNFGWVTHSATRTSTDSNYNTGSMGWEWFELTAAPNPIILDSANALVWLFFKGSPKGDTADFDSLANDFFGYPDEFEKPGDGYGIDEHRSIEPIGITEKTFTVRCYKDGYYGGAGTLWGSEYINLDIATGKRLAMEDIFWNVDSVYNIANNIYYDPLHWTVDVADNRESYPEFKTMLSDFAIQSNISGLLLSFYNGPQQQFITIPYTTIGKFMRPKYWYLRFDL